MQTMPQAPPRLVQTWHYLTSHWPAYPQLLACLCSCTAVCAHALVLVLVHCRLCSCTGVCAHALVFVLMHWCCSHALVFVLMHWCCSHALVFVLMHWCLCSCTGVCAHALVLMLMYSLLKHLMGCVWRISTYICVRVLCGCAERSCVQSSVAVGPGAQCDLSHWLCQVICTVCMYPNGPRPILWERDNCM